jgi:hypothetical protein
MRQSTAEYCSRVLILRKHKFQFAENAEIPSQ